MLKLTENKHVYSSDLECKICGTEYVVAPKDVSIVGYTNPNYDSSWLDTRHNYSAYVIIWPELIYKYDSIIENVQCLNCHFTGYFKQLYYGMFDFKSLIQSLNVAD